MLEHWSKIWLYWFSALSFVRFSNQQSLSLLHRVQVSFANHLRVSHIFMCHLRLAGWNKIYFASSAVHPAGIFFPELLFTPQNRVHNLGRFRLNIYYILRSSCTFGYASVAISTNAHMRTRTLRFICCHLACIVRRGHISMHTLRRIYLYAKIFWNVRQVLFEQVRPYLCFSSSCLLFVIWMCRLFEHVLSCDDNAWFLLTVTLSFILWSV